MAVVETKKNEEIDSKKAESTYRITPKYGVWSKDDKILIQIAIPGVKKEDIEMKVLPQYFTMRATRGEILYTLDLETVKVEPQISSAKYEEGLLKVELKRYNPLEHAYEVQIE